MRASKTLTVLVAGILAATSMSALSQNRQQGQSQGQGQGQGQQQGARVRQMDRSGDHDRAMTQDRLQTRERDRVHQVDPGGAKGSGIYGGNLMTEQERAQYRERWTGLKTDEERSQFMEQHRKEMQTRSRQKGIPIEVTGE